MSDLIQRIMNLRPPSSRSLASPGEAHHYALGHRDARHAAAEIAAEAERERADALRARAEAAEARCAELEGGGWISVRERLPESGETVFITVNGGAAEPGFLFVRSDDTKRWMDERARILRPEAVTHWMPRPPAPEADNDS